jgi:hypothetical protein
MASDIDQILEKLAKDVEKAVHALYRGEMRQNTANLRTGNMIQEARARVEEALGSAAGSVGAHRATPVSTSPRPSVSAPAVAGGAFGWTQDESNAVLKCILAWLPIGGPQSTPPESNCIPAGKMLLPTWAERERAREALKKISQ